MTDLDVYIATEQRFMSFDGRFFAEAANGEDFWRRYLEVFNSVKIVARVRSVNSLPESAVRADGDGIAIVPLPYYVGWRALIVIPSLFLHTKRVTSTNGAFILRVPGFISTFMSFWLRLRHWPYGVEVVGDPYDSLSSRSLGMKWGDWVRFPFVHLLKKQCQHAVGSAYVTRETLQKRYPPGGKFTTHYSSIELNGELIELGTNCYQQRMHEKKTSESFRLIFVGSLSQRYKGLHILLRAVSICQSQGWDLELVILGDGFYRLEYEKLVESLQLQHITFQGYLKQGQAIFEHLSEADLFVMPSLVDGLPRAMIEAMACGLPCIGTRIGGIPELLEDEDIVLPGVIPDLAEKIMEVLSNPSRMRAMSERNFGSSVAYRSVYLRKRRNAFYQFIHDTTLVFHK